jgi:hypothetical protein
MSTGLSPRFSPLEHVFRVRLTHAHDVEQLTHIPFAFREQFLASPELPYRVVLEGTMHHIWHRPRWLSPLFRLLGKAHILVPIEGRNIPTRLEVGASRDACGLPFHVWRRVFELAQPYEFPTTIVYNGQTNQVADLVGPNDILYMVWTARYMPPRTFTLATHSVALNLGGRLLWLSPVIWRWLLGVVRFTQTVDECHDDTVQISIAVRHPLFSDIFGYDGTFRTVRKEK